MPDSFTCSHFSFRSNMKGLKESCSVTCFTKRLLYLLCVCNTGCCVSEFLANKSWCLWGDNCHFKLLIYNCVHIVAFVFGCISVIFVTFRQMCSYYIYGSLLLQTTLLLDMFVFWSLVSCFATGTFPLSFGGARLSENAVRGWLTDRGKRLPGESLYWKNGRR